MNWKEKILFEQILHSKALCSIADYHCHILGADVYAFFKAYFLYFLKQFRQGYQNGTTFSNDKIMQFENENN